MVLPTIQTSRLVLRTITPDDADALLHIFGDPELTRYWGHPALADPAAAKSLVEDIRVGAASGELLQWGIALSGTGDVIGTCTLASLDRQHRRADIGAALASEHHGRGYAEEAVRAVIDHGFAKLGLHRITADVDPRNGPALRLVERLGFREEGLLREHYRQADEWQDGRLFGLLKREWREDCRIEGSTSSGFHNPVR